MVLMKLRMYYVSSEAQKERKQQPIKRKEKEITCKVQRTYDDSFILYLHITRYLSRSMIPNGLVTNSVTQTEL